MASVEEWDRLLAAFQKAQPRVGEILADQQLGSTYGLIYMLQLDLVQELERSGISEKDAIEFVGANAATIREFKKDHPDWTLYVGRLKTNSGPNGKSLFRAACADPSVFSLVAHDRSGETGASLQILRRYATTELPAILLKFGNPPKLLDNAVEALSRFDNEQDPDPAKRQTAARFLNDYQDDDAFKDALIKHGAVLIPALSAGGRDALAQIRTNPNDISKWVDANGKPRGTPFWTYIPGGNIVYAVREKVNGRTLTWGELGWATFDAVLLVPVAGEAALDVKALLNGEKVAADGLVRASAETAGRETDEIVMQGAGKSGGELVVESIATTARVGAAVESRSLLRSAGVKMAAGAEFFGEATSWVVRTAWKYPVQTIFVLYAVSPKIREWLHNTVGGAFHDVGTFGVSIPGHLIEGMWNEVQSLAQKTPMLAPVYYALLAILVLGIVLIPIYLLKKLLLPVYEFVVTPAWSSVRRGIAALRPKSNRVTSTPTP
jgi:hypothetical protein